MKNKKQLNAISKSYQSMKSESSIMLDDLKKRILKLDTIADNYKLYELTNNLYINFKDRIEKKMYVKDIKDLFHLLKYSVKSLWISPLNKDLELKVYSLSNAIHKLCIQHRYYSKVEFIEDLLEG